MKILSHASDLPRHQQPVCVAIGVFDGVHIAHQRVLRQLVETARAESASTVVITFDRHPNAVVAPNRVPPMLYSLQQRINALATLGLDATWVVRFDLEFSQLTGEQFIRGLASDFGQLRRVSVGPDFVFGYRRSGNREMLQILGAELRFTVDLHQPVLHLGEVVSSTRIRDVVGRGDFGQATELLGRPYALGGRVIRGEQIGRTLGIPTANLEVTGRQLPPVGVYAAKAHGASGKHLAVVNIGYRPTVQPLSTGASTPEMRVEAHLLDFSGDLYDQELELTFVTRIRDEMKFASLDDLRRQIVADIQWTREHSEGISHDGIRYPRNGD